MQLDPGPAGHVTCVGRVSAQPHKLWAIKHLLCAPSHVWTQPGSRAAFLTPGAGPAQPSRHPGTPWRCSPSSPKLQAPQLPPEGTSPSVTPCHWAPRLLGSPACWARETGPPRRQPPGTPRVCSGAGSGASRWLCHDDQTGVRLPSPRPNQEQERPGGVRPARPGSKNSPSTPAGTGRPHGTCPPQAAPGISWPLVCLTPASGHSLWPPDLINHPPERPTNFSQSKLQSGRISLSGACPCRQ